MEIKVKAKKEEAKKAREKAINAAKEAGEDLTH